MYFNAVLVGLTGLLQAVLASVQSPSYFLVQTKSAPSSGGQFNNRYMLTYFTGGGSKVGKVLPIFVKSVSDAIFFHLTDPKTTHNETFYTLESEGKVEYEGLAVAQMAYDTTLTAQWEPVILHLKPDTVPIPNTQKTGFYVTSKDDSMYLMWTNKPDKPTGGHFQAWLGEFCRFLTPLSPT